MNDDLIVKQLKYFLAGPECLWCNEMVEEHEGQEIIQCLEGYLFTKEGINLWRLEVGDY